MSDFAKEVLEEFEKKFVYHGAIDYTVVHGWKEIKLFLFHKLAEAERRAAEKLKDDEFADMIATDCHDRRHDNRWCPTCEARKDGIDEYRDALASFGLGGDGEKKD